MPINEKNLNLIRNLEKDFKDHLIWLGREAVNQTSTTIDRYRNLRQFIIGLSVAVVGIVFPIMLANQVFKNNDFFIVSLIYFSIVIIYGICNLIILTINELIKMPAMIESNLQKLVRIIKQLQDIQKNEDNDEAGKKLMELKASYTKVFPEGNLSFLKKIWRRYEGLFFFGFFIVGYIFLIIGFFR